jgi:hypothetical protein
MMDAGDPMVRCDWARPSTPGVQLISWLLPIANQSAPDNIEIMRAASRQQCCRAHLHTILKDLDHADAQAPL